MKVTITGLRHTYQGAGVEARTVLDIDGWSLEAGAHALLRGVSGSGKTTLFNILSGMLRPTHGTVMLGDQSLYLLGEAARDRFRAAHIGYVFQTHQLMPGFSTLENVVMPMMFAGTVVAAARTARARHLLEAVGLGAFTRHRPHQLSTGQRLRVAIARALANAPRLLLADEPTAALDPEGAAAVIDLLQASCRQNDATLLIASHDPALDARFPLQFALSGGRIAPMTTHQMETAEA
jgi:ABC-type lipoprotein export system ATPase subunit